MSSFHFWVFSKKFWCILHFVHFGDVHFGDGPLSGLYKNNSHKEWNKDSIRLQLVNISI